ncbi:cyclic nucleotide-binding domain-containing protein [Deinococcus sp.]|uniref:cyclic nucleotide-binding domain-containing protein n=1 Tax=Deinococcus sp. TaxID=47478 RepID=UPI0028699FD4|nr:cyclic nucleotide-binding domain-containing protein [Deinococcus sp.]
MERRAGVAPGPARVITPALVGSLALFASLDDRALHAVAQDAADMHLNTGEYLVQEGDLVAFFVLLEGELEVTKEVGGALQTLDTSPPGESFGELPLLLGTAATVNLRALGAARVMRLDGPDFMALLGHSETLATTVMANMTRRVGNIQCATL